MGNVGLSAEDLCQQGSHYIGQLGAVCEDEPLVVRSCRLRHGERRWVPESLYRASLVIGADFAQCWGCVDLTCILYGAGGTVIAAVGPRALSRADGVSLDLVNGTVAFNLCMASLSSSVHGLVVFCTPSASKPNEQRPQQYQEEEDYLNEGPVGRGRTFLTTANSCSEDASMTSARHKALPAVSLTGGQKIFEDNSMLQNCVCTFEMEVPARSSQHAAMILLALHCGLHNGDPWEIEAVGRKLQFPPPADSSGPPLVRTFAPTVVQLANKAAKLFGSERIGQLSLPEELALEHQVLMDTPAQDFRSGIPRNGRNADAVAAANRLAGQKRHEAEKERRRFTSQRQSLMTSQEQLRRLLLGLQSMQYGLEAWRREAMLSARQGDSEHVVRMLDRLSTCLVLDDIESRSVTPSVKPSETQCTLPTESTNDEGDPLPPQPSWPSSRDLPQHPSWTSSYMESASGTGNPVVDPHLDLQSRLLPGGAGDALVAVAKPQAPPISPAREVFPRHHQEPLGSVGQAWRPKRLHEEQLTPPRGQNRGTTPRSATPPASRSADDGESRGGSPGLTSPPRPATETLAM